MNWALYSFNALGASTESFVQSESITVIVFVWSEEKGRQQDKCPFGARIKILWEEQLVDPPIDYYTKWVA